MIQGFTFLSKRIYHYRDIRYEVCEYIHDYTGMQFIQIPEQDDFAITETYHVSLSSYLLAKYPCTQAQWKKIMDEDPSFQKSDDHPVECISWDDCQKFCEKTGLCLPTEAQWEYASCRDDINRYFGVDMQNMGKYVWYAENSGYRSQPVGQKLPNSFGLHDMLGNVWEWCYDIFAPYPTAYLKNPTGPLEGIQRIVRGLSFYYYDFKGSCSRRRGVEPYCGIKELGVRFAYNMA